jgi:flagellar hook-length control protein FliK
MGGPNVVAAGRPLAASGAADSKRVDSEASPELSQATPEGFDVAVANVLEAHDVPAREPVLATPADTTSSVNTWSDSDATDLAVGSDAVPDSGTQPNGAGGSGAQLSSGSGNEHLHLAAGEVVGHRLRAADVPEIPADAERSEDRIDLTSAPPGVPVRPETVAHTASVAEAPSAARPLVSQLEGALERARHQPGHVVQLRLEPEGLGSVELRVEMRETGMQVHMTVEHAATRELVEATWPQLTQACEQRGLSIDRVLVDLMGSPAGGSAAFQQRQEQPATRNLPLVGAGPPASRTDELGKSSATEVTEHRIDYRI